MGDDLGRSSVSFEGAGLIQGGFSFCVSRRRNSATPRRSPDWSELQARSSGRSLARISHIIGSQALDLTNSSRPEMPVYGSRLVAASSDGRGRASVKILGQKNPTGAWRVARDFTKNAPSQALIEAWRLKADRVKHTSSATSPAGFSLGHRHHARRASSQSRGMRSAYAIYMVGDSMEPRYEPGWLLHVEMRVPTPVAPRC
jgi:hypothetical protein